MIKTQIKKWYAFFYQGSTHSFNSVIVNSAHTNFPDMKPVEVMNTFINGNILDIFSLNFHNLVWKWLSKMPSGSFTNTIGLFLLIIIFYNFGFNLIGKLGLIFTVGIAILILILQIAVSNIWLKYYRFGP